MKVEVEVVGVVIWWEVGELIVEVVKLVRVG